MQATVYKFSITIDCSTVRDYHRLYDRDTVVDLIDLSLLIDLNC